MGSPAFELTREYENVAQLLDNMSKQIGNHSLRFGVGFEWIRVQTNQPVDPKGSFNFDEQFSQDPSNTNNTGFGGADLLLNTLILLQLTMSLPRVTNAGIVQLTYRIIGERART